MKYKLNTPDVEQSTTLEPNVAYGTPESHYFHNPTSLPVPLNSNIEEIRYNGKIYIAIDSLNPTIEEVKKEWENDGYTWEEDENFITIYREDPLDDNVVKEILINKSRKTYECYDASDYEETSLSLTLEEHIRLTKTFRALDRKV